MNEFSDLAIQTIKYETLMSQIFLGFSSIVIFVSLAFFIYFLKNHKIDEHGYWKVKYFVGTWISGLIFLIGMTTFGCNLDKLLKIKIAPQYFIQTNSDIGKK